jgi:ribA/ribD-fused uncharacterized protein
MKKENGMILFWGGPYSNWYKNSFTFNGTTYNCSEQYMMHVKALMFNDTETAEAIMKTSDPSRQKKYGRAVKNFDKAQWDAVAIDIMVPALVAKFTQSKSLLEEILSTGDDLIVEASPYDKIWGIGLDEDDPRALDQSQWQGTNWLGIAIMKARDIIKEQTHV